MENNYQTNTISQLSSQTMAGPAPANPVMPSPALSSPAAPNPLAGQGVTTQSMPVSLSPVGSPPAINPVPANPSAGLAPVGNQPAALPKIAEVAPQGKPWLVIFSVVAAFVAIIGCFVLYFLNVTTQAEISQTQQKIETITSELANPPLSEAQSVSDLISGALSGYEQAVKQQLNYPMISEKLLSATPKDMKILSLALDEKGSLHVTASFPSFISAGKALLAYRDAGFMTDVKISSIALADKGGTKVVDVNLDAQVKIADFLLAKPVATLPEPTGGKADLTGSASDSSQQLGSTGQANTTGLEPTSSDQGQGTAGSAVNDLPSPSLGQ